MQFTEWFSPTTVHRLERQVVPHFFSGKSPSHTPEKYISLRNKIISKYIDNPTRRLAFGECQSLVSSNTELYDLSRIVRFLDNWGIINYLAIGSVHRGLRMAASLLKEDPATGELQLVTAPLKSIDSLILFDRPKCSLKAEELALLPSSSGSSSSLLDLDNGLADLDEKIREKLLDNSCSYCSVLLPGFHYRSQKEVCSLNCLVYSSIFFSAVILDT
jgi:SWI/SNF related-matrix-associated actin-dependent regulator of chromatin subfamily C